MRSPQRPTAAALATALLLTSVAHAQGPPDLPDLVAEWARGRFVSPVMCEIDGELLRGIRRVVIRPEMIFESRKGLVVQFVDMKIERATRCIDSLGHPQPNVLGKLEIALPGKHHPDTASRDFRRGLRRDRGFEFDVAEGWLKIAPVQSPAAEPEVVDFRGGRVRIGAVPPASDADRELADFDSPKKALLEVETKSGRRLAFPLALAGLR